MKSAFLGLNLSNSAPRRAGLSAYKDSDSLLSSSHKRISELKRSEPRTNAPTMVDTDAEPLSSDAYSADDLTEYSQTPDRDVDLRDLGEPAVAEEPKKVTASKRGKGKQQRKIQTPRAGAWSHNARRKAQEAADEEREDSDSDSKRKRGDDEDNTPIFPEYHTSSNPYKKVKTFGSSSKRSFETADIHSTKSTPSKATPQKRSSQTSPKQKDTIGKLVSNADIKSTSFTGSKAAEARTAGRKTRSTAKTDDLKIPADFDTLKSNGRKKQSFKEPPTLDDNASASSGSSRKKSLVLPNGPDGAPPSSQPKEKPGLVLPAMSASGSKRSTKARTKSEQVEIEDENGDSPPSPVLSDRIDESEDIGKKCPVCGQQVDYDLYADFFFGKASNMRKQIQFCNEHKKRSAKEEYLQRGYPEIDWDRLDDRLQNHSDHLRKVIEGSKSSYFKDVLAEKIASGKERTANEILNSGSFDLLSPGYYGTRGAKVMDQFITDNLAPELRRCAPKDKIIASRGVPGYIQSVLVPELATKLVMEDLRVTSRRAMAILRESRVLGDQINEVAEDVMPRDMMMASQMVVWEDGSDDE